MNADLAARLRRLGVGKGSGALKPPEQRRGAKKIESLIPGKLLAAAGRTCFLAEQRYPQDTLHGSRPLDALLNASPQVAADLAGEPSLAELSFHDLLFLDTETTGLSAGSGTIAFLVGIGYFESAEFCVRQYFLRNPDDEPAMLADLAEQVEKRPGVVSFNGRSFDLPLLESRYILNRRPPPFVDSPHLDLLPPSRRLWRDALDSCRLIALEEQVLAVQRDQADVPGGLIPIIYRDYLRTGNGIEMPRIFYHNQVDVLSMVSLTGTLCRAFADPASELRRGQEWLSLGKWYEALGLTVRAESAYRQAVQSDLPADAFQTGLHRLGWLLKRAGRRDDADQVWQQLAAVEMDDVRGHVELAKSCEWHRKDPAGAAEWTRRALTLVDRWPRGLQHLARPDLVHRLARLERKLAAGHDSGAPAAERE
jgi:uncharacterized protein YprB with RNaseH-like and TPR domain